MTAVISIISGFLHGLVMYTVLLYLPLFYQVVHLQTPFDAALSTLPFCVPIVIFGAVSGVIVDLLRKYCIILWLGWFLKYCVYRTILPGRQKHLHSGIICVSDLLWHRPRNSSHPLVHSHASQRGAC